MANVVARIVLTGGPCAGKTSALSRIDEYFTELGYKVFIVGESATELINGGIRPFGDKSLNTYDFQDIILKYQFQKELLYEEAIKKLNTYDKCIILYDRGLMDNSAYISNNDFSSLLINNNLSRLEIIDRYDLVLHLVTAANGAEEFYTLANNAARSEGINEAISLDKRTMNAWKEHRNLTIIDNSTSFDNKINKTISTINNLLGITSSIRKQRKYLVDLDSKDIFKDAIGIEINQTYLGSDSYERRVRKRTLEGVSSYYFTVQKQDNKGLSNVLVDKKITEKDYYDLLSLYKEKSSINKRRYCFIYNNQHYNLDVYESGMHILETSADEVELPKMFHNYREITCDSEFYNCSLAKKEKVKKLGIS